MYPACENGKIVRTMSASIEAISRHETVPDEHLALTLVSLGHILLSGAMETLSSQSDVDTMNWNDQLRTALGWEPHTIAGISMRAGTVRLSWRERHLIHDISMGKSYVDSAEERKYNGVQTQKNRGSELIHRFGAPSIGGVISKAILMNTRGLGMQYSHEPLAVPLTPQQKLLACGLVLGQPDAWIADQLGIGTGPIRQWHAALVAEQGIRADARIKRNRMTRWLYERRLFVPVSSELAEGLPAERIPYELIDMARPLVNHSRRKRAAA
jgi:hypothetical protein